MTKKKLSFEDHMSGLKDSLEKLDHNELSLEEALKVYEKGIESYKNCNDALSAARTKVQILVESAEKETFADFEEGNLSDDI
ncbi:MAG: exodeoxyribonuclease VII small subunit [Peptostreptococcaceae bacterium]|nr:exodeoxyribonuclease VII small subunit [Peptostreptococcaceae bacterium]